MAACSETYMIVPSPRHICAPRHMYRDQKSGLPEIPLRFAIPILILMNHDQNSAGLPEIYLRFAIPTLILVTRSRYG
eukprot:COSAG01_NODE_1786_length_9231_cov_19.575276_3_plen_77_part_00